jgi:hypothetical protein
VINTGDHEIRLLFQYRSDGKLDTIRRSALDRIPEELAVLSKFFHPKRIAHRYGMANSTLLLIRSHHRDRSDFLQLLHKGKDARCVNSVVVADEDSHSSTAFLHHARSR